jgi:methylthioribose-1-phosphate isomerase
MPGFPDIIIFTTITFDEEKNSITILDQTRLPQKEIYLTLSTTEDVYQAIRTMQVRGAPLIGITAAYGIAMVSHNNDHLHTMNAAERIATARPTAVNLSWAIERMKRKIAGSPDLRNRLVEEARAIEQEDKEACRRIGEYGADLIPGDSTVMVHCNAGALATSGIGTALGIVYTAAHQKNIAVIANETRPLLQGARLTAWELTRNRIDTCVICDNMAATFMPSVSAVIVGADRIAANGDTANKIGTHGLAILARHFSIPLYVAAPTSSFDRCCRNGEEIVIEQRNEEEIRSFNGLNIVPAEACVANPSFDITPGGLITAFVTEVGIIRPPFEAQIQDVIS